MIPSLGHKKDKNVSCQWVCSYDTTFIYSLNWWACWCCWKCPHWCWKYIGNPVSPFVFVKIHKNTWKGFFAISTIIWHRWYITDTCTDKKLNFFFLALTYIIKVHLIWFLFSNWIPIVASRNHLYKKPLENTLIRHNLW